MQLQNAYTVFLYPFRLENEDWKQYPLFQDPDRSIWQRSEVHVDDQMLFEHVAKFFNANTNTELSSPKLDHSQCLIYELKQSFKDSAIDRIAQSASQQVLQEGRNNVQGAIQEIFTSPLSLRTKGKQYQVAFYDGLDKSTMSPKIYFVPSTRVGILSFAMQLQGQDQQLDRLVSFNNKNAVFYRDMKKSPKFRFQNLTIEANSPEQQTEQEVVTDPELQQLANGWGADMPVERKKCLAIVDKIWAICGLKRDAALVPGKEDENCFFTMHQLVHLLMYDLGSRKLEVEKAKYKLKNINRGRFHTFTFVQTQATLSDEALNAALFRLPRKFGALYAPPSTTAAENKSVVRTFRDIYMSTTAEGSCILLNTDQNTQPKYFANYSKNTVEKRYIWIYLLALQQRIAMINTSAKVSELDLANEANGTAQLEEVFKSLSMTQLKAMFGEIAHNSQHNEFYELCRHGLGVNRLFAELKQELEDLNLILQQRYEKKRLEQERQLTEIREKEAKVSERQNWFLNLAIFLLTLLTLIPVCHDFNELWQKGYFWKPFPSQWPFYKLIVALIFTAYLPWLFYKIYTQVWKKKREKH